MLKIFLKTLHIDLNCHQFYTKYGKKADCPTIYQYKLIKKLIKKDQITEQNKKNVKDGNYLIQKLWSSATVE